jgi:hypothetical protein
MNHNATTLHRRRGIVLISLASAGVVLALFVLRRPLMMSLSAPGGLDSAPMTGSPVRTRISLWHNLFDTFNGVVLVALVGVPLAVLAAWALARRRRAAGVASAWRLSLADVGMVYGTVPFLWLTLMPGADAGHAVGRVSLVPLRDLMTMGPVGIFGNLLVFAALGFFAPIRFAALASLPRVLALGAGCSALVETAQYVLRLDRVSSVDDVLVNATGALLAGLASRPWWRTAPGQPPPALASAG